MKKILVLLISILFLFGCAGAHVATGIGENMGKSFQKSYDKGIPSAEQIVAAWPYVSGLIKGLLAEDYDFKMPPTVRNTIRALDSLAEKESLTDEEKGLIVGFAVRLEFLAGKEIYARYGASIYGLIKSFLK